MHSSEPGRYHVIILADRQEQHRVISSEQGRVAEVEPGPGERERLRQARVQGMLQRHSRVRA
jgi:hypothetical protein